MNESANSGLNPYMKPLDKGSLMSRPAPLAVHRPAPAQAAAQPEAVPAPAARRVTFFAREEAEKKAAEAPVTAEQPVQEIPAQLSFFEESPVMEAPAQDAPEATAPEAVEIPERHVIFEEAEEAEEAEAAEEAEPSGEDALYASFTPNEEPAPAEEEEPAEADAEEPAEKPAEEPAPVKAADMPPMIPAVNALEEPAEKSVEAEAGDELPPEPADDGAADDSSYDYEAYYAAYWSQWQAAMEAQQNRVCNVCPLMNQLQGKNASVCLVPVIVTDGQGQAQEPQAVLRMAGVQPAAQMPPADEPAFAEPAFRAPEAKQEEAPDADALWSYGAPVAKVDDDDEYLGEDEMADEDMPVPQTIAPELPDLGLGKKKVSFKWLWIPVIILLSLAALLVIAAIVLSSTGHLEEIVNKLNLPEIVITYLKNFGLL